MNTWLKIFDWKIVIYNQWNKIIIWRLKLIFNRFVRIVYETSVDFWIQNLDKCRWKMKLDGKSREKLSERNIFMVTRKWWKRANDMIILLYREDKLSDRYLKAKPPRICSNNAAQLDYSMIYNPTYEPNRFLSKVLSWRLHALLIGIDSSYLLWK